MFMDQVLLKQYSVVQNDPSEKHINVFFGTVLFHNTAHQ